MFVNIYLPFPPQTGSDIRSIFKRSNDRLNLEFFFTWKGRFVQAKEPSLPYHLLITWCEEEMDSCLSQVYKHVAKCKDCPGTKLHFL